MSDDLTTDDEPEIEVPKEETPKPARSDNRFKDLSEKVETTAKERDEANAAKLAAEKETEFYKGFSKVATKYEGAADYQDKILEKVNSGYDLEDATISVLAKAGKFTAPVKERSSPAGGSASTAIQAGDDKPVNEMSRQEKRAALIEMERTQPGSLSQTLRSTNVG